ncbi:MAG: spermidine synthase [Deltaproteobacteria bacterium]|nr:MAG: spermidine synthase [Deltaproteobacteria bacterium]
MSPEFPGDWLVDGFRHGELVLQRVKRRLHTAETEYQKAELVSTVTYGDALVLDGAIQLAQKDERIYHEVLVHPLLLSLERPARVAILGGGDGAALREVLRHTTVEKVAMVDIDRQVVDFCRQHLPEFNAGAFDDPRTELVFDDARKWVESQRRESWDAVISDLTEPLEGGPSAMLFTREFYESIRTMLAPGGALVVQAGAANPIDHRLLVGIHATVGSVFDQCRVLISYVPSFADQWGFVAGFTGGSTLVEPERVDHLIAQRVNGKMFHYDGTTHLHASSLPLYLRRAIDAGAEPYTDASPPRLATWIGADE